jgi:uncharacterized protein YbjQ (UPF0145 family)
MQVDLGKEVEKTLDGAKEDVYWLFRLIPQEWLQNPWFRIGVAALILVLVLRIGRRIYRFFRRLRPARLNANLAIYGPELTRQKQGGAVVAVVSSPTDEASHIVLSSGAAVKDFIVMRQIGHLHVAGGATAEESLVRLRQAAAQRGANAVINVRRDLGPGGTYVAAGDAVIVVKAGVKAGPSHGSGPGVAAGPEGPVGPQAGGSGRSRSSRAEDEDAGDGGDGADGGGGGDGGGD